MLQKLRPCVYWWVSCVATNIASQRILFCETPTNNGSQGVFHIIIVVVVVVGSILFSTYSEGRRRRSLSFSASILFHCCYF